MADTSERRRPGDPERCARLRALRKARGLTQDQVAERGGLARERVVKLETGWEKGSGHETRKKLARGLGVPVESLDAVLDGKRAPRTVAREAAAGG